MSHNRFTSYQQHTSSTIENAGDLTETASKTVVVHSSAKNLLESIWNVHLSHCSYMGDMRKGTD